MTTSVLNLYAGIGGNRKLWEDVDVTAVEWDEEIARVYQDHFAEDEVIVADAHDFLECHYDDGWDFIWASPPCPTHSQIRFIHHKADDELQGVVDAVYPDMKLYQEIIFLDNYFNGDYVVENVEPYYEPLIPSQKRQRHLFWSNVTIPTIDLETSKITGGSGGKIEVWEEMYGYDLEDFGLNQEKRGKMLRNCVHPKLGKHVFEAATKNRQATLGNIQ